MMPPSMDSSNTFARIDQRLVALEAMLRQIAAASGTLDKATIYKGGLWLLNPDDGSRMRLVDGQIRMWDNYDENPDNYGRILVDRGAGINYMRMLPPFSDSDGTENSLTIQGRRDGQAGNLWAYTDGAALVRAGGNTFIEAGADAVLDADANAFVSGQTVNLNASNRVNINGTNSVGISAPRLELLGLPAVGSPDYTLGYRVSGEYWSVCLVTSARKYKQDIKPAAIDTAKVLQIEPVQFRSKSSVEADPDSKMEFGVIADQLDELGLGELLVTYKDGEPEAAKYDRLALVQQPVLQDHERRVVELEATVATQADQIEALTAQNALLAARLDALEAK